ncbi:MAG: ArdC family protein [Acetobacteraceae bacterium]
MPSDKRDLYQSVTDSIIAQLEAGVKPWERPWSAEHAAGRITRPLRFNGAGYNGLNVLLLWVAADAKGYTNPIWVTFKQAQAAGGQVRKGERSTPIIYADKIRRQDEETGEEKEIWFLKGYNVFNVEQVDGLPAHFYALAETPKLAPEERNQKAEAFISNTGADIRHGGNRAYYSQADDHVQMPPFITFETPEAYYGTCLHELTHWSKHPTRLDRDFGRKKWGDEGYAMEELVAEINAALLCADLGLELTPREEHASYIDSWLKVLKSDKRAIFQAAAHAQKAADYLHSLQPKVEMAPVVTVTVEEPAPPPPALPEPEQPQPGGFAARERKRREARKVIGQTELF